MTVKPRPDDKKQVVAFRKAARILGCDESEEHFDTALAKVARHKPTHEPKDTPRAPRGKK
jgi:hypothetical protein